MVEVFAFVRLSPISRCLKSHTCPLHPLECITTICNSSPTLHPRGVNNTSPALGGVSAECICKLELQPSLYNCSGASCNCRQYSAIAAEHCSAAIADCRHIRSFGVFAMERQHCSSSQVPICRCCNCKEGNWRQKAFSLPPPPRQTRSLGERAARRIRIVHLQPSAERLLRALAGGFRSACAAPSRCTAPRLCVRPRRA